MCTQSYPFSLRMELSAISMMIMFSGVFLGPNQSSVRIRLETLIFNRKSTGKLQAQSLRDAAIYQVRRSNESTAVTVLMSI